MSPFVARTLDELHLELNERYLGQNFYRGPDSMFAHLVEVLTPLGSALARQKHVGQEKDFLAKGLAWWMTLCGKVGVVSVAALVWIKFPGVCPYCLVAPHRADCKVPRNDGRKQHPDWAQLLDISARTTPPNTISDWQSLFRGIYPTNSELSDSDIYERLIEEIGELSEGVRLLPATQAYFLNEASDVFAWIMATASRLDRKYPQSPSLETIFIERYAGKCPDCHRETCECGRLLREYFTRRSAEMPPQVMAELRDNRQGFTNPADALRLFAKQPQADGVPTGRVFVAGTGLVARTRLS